MTSIPYFTHKSKSRSTDFHQNNDLITHSFIQNDDFDILMYRNALKNRHDPSFSLDEQLQLLDDIAASEMGRFLLKNRGLNGFWTAFIILHAPLRNDLSPADTWIVHHAPVVKATRERFYIFRKMLQHYLKSDTTIASLPCGLMDDLLGLDFSNVHNVNLVGIDLDDESLTLAEENAHKYGYDFVSFDKKSAWNLGYSETFDIITSNGLNIYEHDDDKVVALYTEFCKALKPGGIFITSFLTPPPALCPSSPWKNYDQEALIKQKMVLSHIIQVNWQAYRTEEQTREQLENAGFVVRDIIYDAQSMFPTVVAQKITS